MEIVEHNLILYTKENIMADWQVYLMMTAIVAAMLIGKTFMFLIVTKKSDDKKSIRMKIDKSKIIEYIFSSASIQRWNDYPRMVDLVELDKQAHKFIIAYFIAKT